MVRVARSCRRTGQQSVLKPKQFRWRDAEGRIPWHLAEVRSIQQEELGEEVHSPDMSFEEMVRRDRAGERQHLEELRRVRERCTTVRGPSELDNIPKPGDIIGTMASKET